ncbi:MAG: VanZ family protein [Eubacterium sp.]|jgi:VanZ family protein|nr:VanZ family protein [Eubacterium sp.]
MIFKSRRVLFSVISIVWAAVIFGVSSIPGSGLPQNMNYWTNIGHFAEYLILTVFIVSALQEQTRALWKTAMMAVVIASLYGASDEFHQLFVGGRYADVFDWMTDTIGAFVGALITLSAIHALNRGNKLKEPQ